MRFQHTQGEDSPSQITVERYNYEINAEGVFNVPERYVTDDVLETLKDAGHEPVEEESTDGSDGSEDSGKDETEAGIEEFKKLSESDIVDMEYSEKQDWAGLFNTDEVDGSASGDQMEEELIIQLRELSDE